MILTVKLSALAFSIHDGKLVKVQVNQVQHFGSSVCSTQFSLSIPRLFEIYPVDLLIDFSYDGVEEN